MDLIFRKTHTIIQFVLYMIVKPFGKVKKFAYAFIYLTAEETHIIQYPFNTRNPYQILP